MPSKIEAELRSRCAQNENLGLLLAQWEYDRKLLGQALTTVGHAFPHYSLHDATHSETILERIAAMLDTEGLSHLSATDLWLLLESAYLHDSGMVVIEATRRKDLISPEFEAHLRSLAESSNRELAARAVRILGTQLPQDRLGILEGHLDLLLVYAEFVRKQHPRRAEKVAQEPFETARIESPRTTLIPNRFWHLIGRICRAHGESRDFALRELPLKESGIGGEICHPRFVACMLRLGDLLDLDSGRFCPVLSATIPHLPSLSEAHRAKHAGIRHLLVCPSRVEVSGVYNDVEAYLEAEAWFTWLREELSAQLVQWDEIAPPHFNRLPSAGVIEARLEGQVTLDAKARPRFEVDREKMLELVRGANIYEGPEDAVREVIQNAIDATLFRFSYESQSRGDAQPKDLDELRARLSSYPINVRLTKSPEPRQGMIEWILCVEDQGIGIRIEDAKFMLTLGSSKNNLYRKVLREWLPDWARPSGTFGIGFHSLFLFCHDVRVLSRHPDDLEGIELHFMTTPETSEPTVVIRRRKRLGREVTFAPQAGTIVELRIQVGQFPKDWRSTNSEASQRALADYDLTRDKDIPYDAMEISDRIYKIESTSLCPLHTDLPVKRSSRIERHSPPILRYFDRDEGIEIRVTECGLGYGAFKAKYRGAAIGEWNLMSTCLRGECDLHTSEASDFLEISRNKFTRSGLALAQRRFKSALRTAASEWLTQLRQSSRETDKNTLSYISLFALINNIERHGDEWRAIPFTSRSRLIRQEPKVLNLGTIASADSIVLSDMEPGFRGDLSGEIVLSVELRTSEWLPIFLRKFFPGRTLLRSDHFARSYRLTKHSNEEEVSDEALVDMLRIHDFQQRRQVLPCPSRFAGLACQIKNEFPWHTRADPLISASMLSPFVFTRNTPEREYSVDIPRAGDYVHWVAEQRKEPEAVVATRALEFIKHVDQLMEEHWGSAKIYNLRKIEAEFSLD